MAPLAQSEGEDARDLGRFLPTGTVLRGKYRIDGVIGTGGMAVVYAATHRNRKRFAVKMLHPELSTRQEVRARFIREGYVANSVEHPGVVSVLDDDVTEDGSAFLVMELLEGATVEGFGPRSRPLPLRETLSIAYDVLSVLDAAHAKNIVHRDIKPANLFVTRQGQLKVLDFGIARLRDATLGVKATGTGATLGTPAFMAPEQALAIASEIDARTDLWAVGATVFTMLSGCLVHAGDNARQVMVRAATEPARSLASVAPDLPAGVVDWVSKALLFDRKARWESAAAMRDAVARLHRDLFGEFEEGRAERLFELSVGDVATLPTEQSPAGALRSAVRETARTTLESFQGNSEARSSIPAPPPDRASGPARRRRLSLALIGVAATALGVGLTFGFVRPARQVEVSLSAARTSSSTVARPLGSLPTIEGPSATARPQAAPPATAAAPPAEASRSRAPAPLPRVRSPKPPAASATPASATPPATTRVPSAAPPPNPLQIEIQ
jgi:serine/threonine protein kinase